MDLGVDRWWRKKTLLESDGVSQVELEDLEPITVWWSELQSPLIKPRKHSVLGDFSCLLPSSRHRSCFCIGLRSWSYGMLNICWFSSVQSLSCVRLFVTPWTAAHQASLSITNSWSLLKLMSVGLVMPSNPLILCCPLLLLPSIFPSIRVFYNESVLRIRWPKYWSFSFNISPSNEHSGLIPFRIDWLDLLAVQRLSRVYSNTMVQKHQFFATQLSL